MFASMIEFYKWKEMEEEATYTTYVRGDRTYQPKTWMLEQCDSISTIK